MLGSAGSIISMASGFRAMIEAITTTNSGKPIGRWLDETQASALISVTLGTSQEGHACIGYAALHNPFCGMAGARLPAFNIREENLRDGLAHTAGVMTACLPLGPQVVLFRQLLFGKLGQ
jgi:hypothetical protein